MLTFKNSPLHNLHHRIFKFAEYFRAISQRFYFLHRKFSIYLFWGIVIPGTCFRHMTPDCLYIYKFSHPAAPNEESLRRASCRVWQALASILSHLSLTYMGGRSRSVIITSCYHRHRSLLCISCSFRGLSLVPFGSRGVLSCRLACRPVGFPAEFCYSVVKEQGGKFTPLLYRQNFFRKKCTFSAFSQKFHIKIFCRCCREFFSFLSPPLTTTQVFLGCQDFEGIF